MISLSFFNYRNQLEDKKNVMPVRL